MFRKVFLDAPNVSAIEKGYLNKAIDSRFVSAIGPFVGSFEKKFAAYLKTKRAVSVQSGTAALYMALYELGIGKGDEVIVPVLTFIATVNPIIQLGARPVFVDVDRETWNISPSELVKAITKRTKAIIPVHLYGNPCDMGSLKRIAKERGLYIIEDATESLGAVYSGKITGTIGDLGCFSFNGNKIITTGGGGMIAGNKLKSLEHIKFLVNQARDELRGYYHPEIGFNYRMTNIEAALGLAQMTRLKSFLERKKMYHDIYIQELGGINEFTFQKEYSCARSSWWFTCILLKDKSVVPSLMKGLNKKGIPSRRIFMPLVDHPPYKNLSKGKFENARFVYEHGLCLPSSTLNTAENIRNTCKILKKELLSHGKN
ncbi:MAG: DegT/DnrJ/EryC1/StrS family aminotransferase [Elusimicrobia bacterium]|nr:DegT/DnrJ/EryC1/StrS family aminotransferase [Elusimicrobiota bacterium]